MLIRRAGHSLSPARTARFITLCAAAAVLTACGSNNSRYTQSQDSAPDRPIDVSQVKDAIPRLEPKSRYGNPPSYVVRGKRYHTLASSTGYSARGIASWYGTKFHGHRTSSGEPYDMYQMTAAHKTLPLPTYARVTNLRNGKSAIVKINDRGPFHDNRLIDLSYAAASKLGILGKGTGLVEVKVIDPGTYAQQQSPKRQITASKPKTDQRLATTAPAEKPSLYLQVGAFSNRSNAERLQSQLSTNAGLPGKLHIIEGFSNQQRVYRVRIGPLASVESADQLAETLSNQGIRTPRVVVD
jgi:rare lipoprotein A